MKNWKRKLIIIGMITMVLLAYSYNQYSKEQNRNRRSFAKLVFYEYYIPTSQVNNYLSGIDFSKPVKIIHLHPGDKVIQYQTRYTPQGNFYGFPGSTPSKLGISSNGWDPKLKEVVKKIKKCYTAINEVDTLSSYSAPVKDNWSTPKIETKTEGSDIQLFTTCKECFKEETCKN